MAKSLVSFVFLTHCVYCRFNPVHVHYTYIYGPYIRVVDSASDQWKFSLYMYQIVASSMLPLVSGINSRLPSVNHALMSPILPHPVHPPSVPSTHHFRRPLPLHSSTPGLKLSFSTNPFHRSQLTFSSSGLTPRIPWTVYRNFWASLSFLRLSVLLIITPVTASFPGRPGYAGIKKVNQNQSVLN